MGGKVEVISGTSDINMYRMLTLKHALHLECLGMKRRGQSVLSIVKREFKLIGNRQSVYEQFCTLVDEAKQDQQKTLLRADA